MEIVHYFYRIDNKYFFGLIAFFSLQVKKLCLKKGIRI